MLVPVRTSPVPAREFQKEIEGHYRCVSTPLSELLLTRFNHDECTVALPPALTVRRFQSVSLLGKRVPSYHLRRGTGGVRIETLLL